MDKNIDHDESAKTPDFGQIAKDIGLALADGYTAFNEKREQLLKQGIDHHTASVEAFKAKHAAEANRYEVLMERFTQANDLKSASIFAREAEKSKMYMEALARPAASAEHALKYYAETYESIYKKGMASAAGAGKFISKNVGTFMNAAELGQALASGNPTEVTKAVSGIAIGELAVALAEGIAVTAGLAEVGTGIIVFLASVGAARMVGAIDDKDWDKLTGFIKQSIEDMSNAIDKGLKASLEDIIKAMASTFGGDISDMADAINDKFLAALNLIRRIDPLVLDLDGDGDGIETLGADAGVLFDFNGDGVKTGTGWIKGDDAFLVLDRNGNGLIDSGQELFGVDTVKRDGTKARNGFDALADLDSNGDGLFDANDEMFSQVRLWQDLNHDGIAQANELKTLAEHGIAAIVLKSKEANEDSNGNLISATGSFIRDDGSEGEVNGNQSVAADVDLESNPFYSEHTGEVALDDEVRKLPNLQGSGLVRELREAAMLSPALRELIATYAASGSHREQREMLDRIIAAWAATGEGFKSFEQRIDGLDRDGVDFRFGFSWETSGKEPTASQALFHDRLAQLNALESFNGQAFLEFSIVSMTAFSASILVRMGANTVTRTMAIRNGVAILSEADLPIPSDSLALLESSYSELMKSVAAGLLLQTRLKNYADLVDISMNGDVIAPDFCKVFGRLADVANNDPVNAVLDGLDLLASLKTFDKVKLAGFLESWIATLSNEQRLRLKAELAGERLVILDTSSSSTVNSGNGNDLVLGQGGNDRLSGQEGHDFIWGQDGNDSLYGNDGDDVLVGGAGNDRLEGGKGSDTYVFGRGHGWDSIYNADSSTGRWDVLQFLDGISAEDLFVRRGKFLELFIYVKGSSEGVTIFDYFKSETYRLNEIRFADGTTWTYEQINAMVLASTGEDDALYGYGSDDHILGGAGNDTLYGNGGADRLEGGEGNDFLYGGDGNDVLIGGAGKDRLEGGKGSDTYVFGRGDGWDSIYNMDSSTGRWDVLQFLEGITPDDIFVRRGKFLELFIYVKGSNDGITIFDYFKGEDCRLNEIRFADGTSWSFDQIKAMVLVSTDNDETLYGYNSDDHLDSGLGDDTLYGNGGADRLEGGEGNDFLYGGDGNDVLIGGAGKDQLEGGKGSDTYVFGRGDGWDSIYNMDSSAGRWDVLQFLEGITPDDVFVRRGKFLELFIYVKNSNEGITVFDYFKGENYRLNEIRFNDGTSWAYADLQAIIAAPAKQDAILGRSQDGACWPSDHEVNSLISAMASYDSSTGVPGHMHPPMQHSQANWASLSI